MTDNSKLLEACFKCGKLVDPDHIDNHYMCTDCQCPAPDEEMEVICYACGTSVSMYDVDKDYICNSCRKAISKAVTERVHPKIFDLSETLEQWCGKVEHLLDTVPVRKKREIRQGVVKLAKEYWVLEGHMQVLVSRVNNLLKDIAPVLSLVDKYQLKKFKRSLDT